MAFGTVGKRKRQLAGWGGVGWGGVGWGGVGWGGVGWGGVGWGGVGWGGVGWGGVGWGGVGVGWGGVGGGVFGIHDIPSFQAPMAARDLRAKSWGKAEPAGSGRKTFRPATQAKPAA